ncbi:MAG: hypothetical protein OXE99_01320 [Cellvibrionales bacterium]|nr:hypothetical protein [Cellvibrionales bacterium]
MKPRCSLGYMLKRSFWLALSFIGLVAFNSSVVMAGAEGYVIMTYYFDSPLAQDLKVDLSTSGDHQCMYDWEIKDQTSFTIPKGTIGLYELNKDNGIYYECKSSSTAGDTCATDPSYFHVEVKASDSRYSWTAPLKVRSGNFFYPNSNRLSFFGDDPSNQFICVGRSLCSNKKYEYHYTNKATLHVIYRPTY